SDIARNGDIAGDVGGVSVAAHALEVGIVEGDGLEGLGSILVNPAGGAQQSPASLGQALVESHGDSLLPAVVEDIDNADVIAAVVDVGEVDPVAVIRIVVVVVQVGELSDGVDFLDAGSGAQVDDDSAAGVELSAR